MAVKGWVGVVSVGFNGFARVVVMSAVQRLRHMRQAWAWLAQVPHAWRCLGGVACYVLLAVYPAGAQAAESTPTANRVLHTYPSGPIFDYRWQLLTLALQHADAPAPPPKLVARPDNDMTQDRSILMLRAGELDVLAFGSTPEREAKLRPIRIDILRGLLGYRVLLIRDTDQPRFTQMNLDQLRQQVTLGFNSQWADRAILEANGFRVTTSPGYDNLFTMLSSGRFDAFPRGVNEAWGELETWQPRYPNLAVEKSLALFTDYPVYFWVRQDDTALAARIERGLRLALEDGSFKALFLHYHAAEIARIRQERRRVFRLKNPLLGPDTPKVDTHWWWNGTP